jgi:two-component system nitrogen regulation response regulator GlnG
VNTDSSITLQPLDSLRGGTTELPLIPAFTIAWHPDSSRVGQIAPLTRLLECDEAPLRRDEPIFFKAGSSIGSPVESRFMSRAPVLLVASTGRGLELRRGSADSDVEVDGTRLAAPRVLADGDLVRGVVVTVARRVAFVLHAVRFPIARSPDLGLLGTSDAIEDARRLILRVASRRSPVLIRGQSGTGKELVARAIHAQGGRTAGRLVDVNMGLLRPERAAAELFGYERGAFTGASEAHAGAFRQAHGGTLFLDEIGFTALEVQQALLRAWQDHRVQALGASTARPVDVRVICATDANLEDLRDSGRMLESFYNRLNAAFTIRLPPLRERREDVGMLLARFLEGARTGGRGGRLDGGQLKAPTVARLIMSPLDGNVRMLEGLAETLAIREEADPDVVLRDYLAQARGPEGSVGVEGAPVRAVELSKERLLAALERCGWNQAAAARSLKVSRQALGRRLDTEPDIRRVIEIPIPELLRDHEECGRDLEALSRRLGLPPALLRRRLPQVD